MLNTILGSKVKMSQTFVDGKRFPVTLVKTSPCIVVRTHKNDETGVWRIQLGYGDKKVKNITKPMQGHLRGVIKENKAPLFLREFVIGEEQANLKPGDKINVGDILKPGDFVQVTGVSKGKGFQGVVKRHHFKGGPRTHGQSDRERAPGSIGSTTTPGRVFKGKKMAGRMGGERVTVKNLKVIGVVAEKDEINLSGPIPGAPGSLIILTKIEGKEK